MNEDGKKRRNVPLTLGIGSIIVAAVWPLIYPGLNYLMALIGFGSSPGLFKALQEFGPLYGKLSPAAPDFFKGMTEASQQMSGEHAALASLPYIIKAKLLMYACLPVYIIEVLVFIAVGSVSVLSRLVPWQKAKAKMQSVAMVVSVLPLIAIFLWWFIFVGVAYVQTWSVGLLEFLFLVLIFPVVLIKVALPLVGAFVLSRYLVPGGLVFAGKDSKATDFYDSMLSDDPFYSEI